MATTNPQKGEDMDASDRITHPGESLFERIQTVCIGKPRVAILMSGGGSNARKILDERYRYPNFDFIAIGTDNPGFHGAKLARDFDLAWVLTEHWDHVPFDRSAYFGALADSFHQLGINLVLYAGFMKIAPRVFLHEFPGINIHPADLTIVNDQYQPKYTGLNAVAYAVKAGESYIASTIHVVDETVDGGTIIAVSKHVPLLLEGLSELHELQEKLKQTGEHTLYPQVLALLSRGKITKDMLPLHAEHQDLNALFYS